MKEAFKGSEGKHEGQRGGHCCFLKRKQGRIGSGLYFSV